jgi:hypothetical protein
MCRTVVTVAMINTAQNKPVSAEKTKRESIVQPTYVDPHYDVRISPSQSLNVPAGQMLRHPQISHPCAAGRQALTGGFRASALHSPSGCGWMIAGTGGPIMESNEPVWAWFAAALVAFSIIGYVALRVPA